MIVLRWILHAMRNEAAAAAAVASRTCVSARFLSCKNCRYVPVYWNGIAQSYIYSIYSTFIMLARERSVFLVVIVPQRRQLAHSLNNFPVDWSIGYPTSLSRPNVIAEHHEVCIHHIHPFFCAVCCGVVETTENMCDCFPVDGAQRHSD